MANDLVVEVGDLVGPTIAVRILQDLDRIAAIAHMGALGVHSAVLLGSIRILDRAADPEATFGIEGHVGRFVDHRLAGEKLNLTPPVRAASFAPPQASELRFRAPSAGLTPGQKSARDRQAKGATGGT